MQTLTMPATQVTVILATGKARPAAIRACEGAGLAGAHGRMAAWVHGHMGAQCALHMGPACAVSPLAGPALPTAACCCTVCAHLQARGCWCQSRGPASFCRASAALTCRYIYILAPPPALAQPLSTATKGRPCPCMLPVKYDLCDLLSDPCRASSCQRRGCIQI